MNNDTVLKHLNAARDALLAERDKNNSRELSVTLTELETAIMWREKDVQLKQARQSGQ